MINLAILTIFLLSGSAETEVRIDLLSLLSPQTVIVENETDASVAALLDDGERQISVHRGERLIIKLYAESLLVSVEGSAVPFEAECGSIHFSRSLLRLTVPRHEQHRRRVEADIHVEPGERFLKISAYLPLEQAVAEITAAEMGGRDVPLEALKAQAVCVRTYISFILAAQPQQGLSDTTAHMLYRGIDGAFGPDGPISILQGGQAARETEGLVLAHGDYIWPAFFHACCGGETKRVTSVFGPIPQHLSYAGDAVECKYCSESAHYRWQWSVDSREFARKVFAAEIVEISPDLAKNTVQIVKNGVETVDFTFDTFRLLVGRAFGWDTLRSNVFTVAREGNTYVFVGRGAGHNIGFCQAGAIEAGRRGMNWKELLAYYYPSCGPRQRSLARLFSPQ